MRLSSKLSILSAMLFLVALSTSAVQAAIIVVDDFSTDYTANNFKGIDSPATPYVQSALASGGATINFSTVDTVSPAYPVYAPLETGTHPGTTLGTAQYPDKLTYSFTGATSSSAATQALLLRDDFELTTAGDWVQLTSTIDSAQHSGNQNAATRLGAGLAIAQKGATSLATGSYTLYMRANRQLPSLLNGANHLNGAANATFLQLSTSTVDFNDPITYRFTRIANPSDPTNATVDQLRSSYSLDYDPITQTGTFTDVTTFSLPGTLTWANMGFGVFAGNSVTANLATISFDNLTANITPVPEPTTYLIGALGLVGFGLLRRKTQL